MESPKYHDIHTVHGAYRLSESLVSDVLILIQDNYPEVLQNYSPGGDNDHWLLQEIAARVPSAVKAVVDDLYDDGVVKDIPDFMPRVSDCVEPVNKMMKVYIAGPYTKGDVAVNVRNAMAAANTVINAGHAPFCPHLYHFLHMASPQPYGQWLDIDMEFLRVCDAVIRLPGESKGADKEVVFAQKLKIPVYFDTNEFFDHHFAWKAKHQTSNKP